MMLPRLFRALARFAILLSSGFFGLTSPSAKAVGDGVVVWGWQKYDALPGETEIPYLYSLTPGSSTNGPMTIGFDLPENAAPSTVKLKFTGATTVDLTLDAPRELAGYHEFTFAPSDPESGPFTGNRPPIPDGYYTVTLSYRDAALNPEATSDPIGVTIDTVAPTITPPMGGLKPRVVPEGEPLPNYTIKVSATDVDGSGLASLSQSPPAGTVLPVGTHNVVLTATDYAGNEASLTFKIRIAPTDPALTVVLTTGGPVPGAGVAGSEIPEGAVWDSFGSPAINDASDMAMVATYRAGKAKYKNIVLKRGSEQDVTVIARTGGTVPGAGSEWDLPANATFATLNDPLLAADGSLLFVAAIKGTGVHGVNNKVVVHYSPAAANSDGGARVVARTGLIIPTAADATLKTIAAIALESGGAAVLRGTLRTGSGSPKVGPTNDAVALRLHASGEAPTVLLREGHSPGGTVPVLKSFLTLVAGDGTQGQGRGWLVREPVASGASEGGGAIFTAVATGADGARFVVETSFESGTTRNAIQLTGPPIVGGIADLYKSVGLPSRSAEGELAIRAVPHNVPGNPAVGPTVVVLDAQGGAPQVLNSITFWSVRDPILSLDGSTAAAMASISFSQPGARKYNAAVWWSTESPQSPQVLASQLFVAPDSNEGVFKSVTSFAVPGGTYGPIFTASLVHRKVRPQGPPVATNSANDVGLWAVDSAGVTRLLLREGDPLGDQTVKSFHVLKAATGAQGVTRNFNTNAEIAVLVTATDHTTHIVKILVP